MDDLSYELLSKLAGGHKIFHPRDHSALAKHNFQVVVELLQRLQNQGFVAYQPRHIAQSESGAYLMVGPVDLTPEGNAALDRDRRLGARPPASGGPLPWRPDHTAEE